MDEQARKVELLPIRKVELLPEWGTQGGTAVDLSGEIGAPNFVPLPIFDSQLGARGTTALPMQGTKDGKTVENPGENGIIVSKGTESVEDVGKIITEIKYKPSSGVIFETNPDKTTTILGSYEKDMKNVVNEIGNVKLTYFGAKKEDSMSLTCRMICTKVPTSFGKRSTNHGSMKQSSAVMILFW